MDAMPNRIREHRERAGLSQRALAELAGVDHAQVSRWESGGHMPSVDKARALARALEVSVEDLFNGEAA